MTTTAEELHAALAQSRERLLRAIAGVSEEQFKKRPPAGDGDTGPAWSIAEVLAHLLQHEKLRAASIALALETDGAPIRPLADSEDSEGARAGRTAPVPQLIHGLLAARRGTERLLDTAAERDGLQRAVTHPRRGRQTIEGLIVDGIVAHEEDHAEQIAGLRELVGAPPVGAGNQATGNRAGVDRPRGGAGVNSLRNLSP